MFITLTFLLDKIEFYLQFYKETRVHRVVLGSPGAFKPVEELRVTHCHVTVSHSLLYTRVTNQMVEITMGLSVVNSWLSRSCPAKCFASGSSALSDVSRA